MIPVRQMHRMAFVLMVAVGVMTNTVRPPRLDEQQCCADEYCTKRANCKLDLDEDLVTCVTEVAQELRPRCASDQIIMKHKCLPRRRIGERCEQDIQCADYGGSCLQSLCKCNMLEFDRRTGRCYDRYSSLKCTLNEEQRYNSVETAECEESCENRGYLKSYCDGARRSHIHDADPVRDFHRCICKEGYVRISKEERTCVLKANCDQYWPSDYIPLARSCALAYIGHELKRRAADLRQGEYKCFQNVSNVHTGKHVCLCKGPMCNYYMPPEEIVQQTENIPIIRRDWTAVIYVCIGVGAASLVFGAVALMCWMANLCHQTVYRPVPSRVV